MRFAFKQMRVPAQSDESKQSPNQLTRDGYAFRRARANKHIRGRNGPWGHSIPGKSRFTFGVLVKTFKGTDAIVRAPYPANRTKPDAGICFCSFCGRSSAPGGGVALMIHTPPGLETGQVEKSYICDKCVTVASDVVNNCPYVDASQKVVFRGYMDKIRAIEYERDRARYSLSGCAEKKRKANAAIKRFGQWLDWRSLPSGRELTLAEVIGAWDEARDPKK